YGDWRELFRQIDRIDNVSKADIRRVANKIFTEQNRTVGVVETASPVTPRPPAIQHPNPTAPAPSQPKGGQQ
ncbi:MAG: hypothetical protein ACRD4F_04850, partial [Candidatus Angelobacter sp.]